MQSAEDVASMVWSFLSAAGALVDGLDKDDEVKLLRLRTKKNELVIVPGMYRPYRTIRPDTHSRTRPQIHSRCHTRYSTSIRKP